MDFDTNYQIQEMTKHDIPRLVELFRSSFSNNKLTKEYLEWLYYRNPDGDVIAVNAFWEGNVVGHYALIPYCGVSNFKYALSINTATHPDHTGKGLFTNLAKKTYKLAYEKYSYSQFLGVANANSIHGFISKLGFQKLGNVNVVIKRTQSLKEHDLEALNTCNNFTWRLENPNVKYWVSSFKDRYLIFTKYKNLPILLAASPSHTSIFDCIEHIPLPLFSVIPYWSNTHKISGFSVPNRMLPSPWHVIAKGKMQKFTISGLSMDSF